MSRRRNLKDVILEALKEDSLASIKRGLNERAVETALRELESFVLVEKTSWGWKIR